MGIEENRRKIEAARRRADATIAASRGEREARLADLVDGSPVGDALGPAEAAAILRGDGDDR